MIRQAIRHREAMRTIPFIKDTKKQGQFTLALLDLNEKPIKDVAS